MVPVGYMAKRVYKRPDWLKAPHVADIYSVSGCVSEDFADYINFWKHNGFWLFDSPEVIKDLAEENSIQMEGTSLFYYEAHEMELDGERWRPWLPEPSFPTLSESILRVLTWSLSTLEIRPSIPLSRATRWQNSLTRILTVFWDRLTRPKHTLTKEYLRTLSPVRIEYLRCIP